MRHQEEARGRQEARSRLANRLAIAQGTFFAASGIWPILHMRSFEAVTGPKTDKWLVRTVGALVSVIGGALISAGKRDRVTPEIGALAASSAAALAVIDCVYVTKGRISRIYLLDAAVELGFVAAWTFVSTEDRLGGRVRRRIRVEPRAREEVTVH